MTESAQTYWIAVRVPAADIDEDLPDALSYAASRAETVLQEERGYDADAWYASSGTPQPAVQPPASEQLPALGKAYTAEQYLGFVLNHLSAGGGLADTGAMVREALRLHTAELAAGQQPADQTAEEHRLALSLALGLGTGAPWDAIRDRADELRRMADEAQQRPASPSACPRGGV
ncbi:hypothetical protein ACFC08_17925 [Streptomyces sp. NPDC056112]|uniref:hypothetical protein n=1 Tax=Streptomyces sp. NPDC056112 TaxID=3345715 RepID=UPI0035D591C6